MKNEAGGGGSLQGNELKLDDQCLSSLPGWVVETPRHAAVLKILYLNKNQFTRLPALLGLPHLEKLNMAGNSLSVIHAGVLPPSLLVLELINNQITTIEPGAFAALRKLPVQTSATRAPSCAVSTEASASRVTLSRSTTTSTAILGPGRPTLRGASLFLSSIIVPLRPPRQVRSHPVSRRLRITARRGSRLRRPRAHAGARRPPPCEVH